MGGPYELSWATRADHASLADVMFEAVRHGSSPYTEDQRAAWLPRPPQGGAWTARLDRQAVVVARSPQGVAGFMSIALDGYIDLAHITPAHRGAGLFRLLYTYIEALSLARGDARMRVHASRMAEPAFAAMGFAVIERQRVAIGDETLDRAEMEKAAPAAG